METNGPNLDSIVSLKADYEALVKDGLRNIELLQKLGLDKESIQLREDLLNSIDAAIAMVNSQQKTSK